MMVVNRHTGQVSHKTFKDFPSYFRAGDVLVRNSTRVIPARAWGRAGSRLVEFLFVRNTGAGCWEVLCRPAKQATLGAPLLFARGRQARVVEVQAEGKRVLDFGRQDVRVFLQKFGYAPLPPYIKRAKISEELRADDRLRYQTVYARNGESIAAPTAGLHFTPEILHRLAAAGVQTLSVNLDVGLATFQPVRVERLENHRLPEETYNISPRTAARINAAKREGRPVAAVGTTVVRSLESATEPAIVKSAAPLLGPGRRPTRLFVTPGYRFQITDRLLTNFHLPRSTLLMLVTAFAGRELILKAYREAVREGYRFFSYGDCMLIL